MSKDPHLQTLAQELQNVIYEARQRTREAAHKKEEQHP